MISQLIRSTFVKYKKKLSRQTFKMNNLIFRLFGSVAKDLRLLLGRDEQRRERDRRVRRLRHRRARGLLRNRGRNRVGRNGQRRQHGLVGQHRALVLWAVQSWPSKSTKVSNDLNLRNKSWRLFSCTYEKATQLTKIYGLSVKEVKLVVGGQPFRSLSAVSLQKTVF